MKVNVVQLEEISFKRYRWWSSWIDIAVFEHNINTILLQMKVSRLNKKKFKTINMTMPWINLHLSSVGDLKQMGDHE